MAASSHGRAPKMATAERSSGGSVATNRPSSRLARQTTWVGGKSSAFQDPGPTAHPNTSSVSSRDSR